MILAPLISLGLIACEPGPPKTRVEAVAWLKSHWEMAKPHAEELSRICSENPDRRTLSRVPLQDQPMLDPELRTRVISALDQAEAGFAGCNDKGVFLPIGSGIEELDGDLALQFDGAYHQEESAFQDPRCEDAESLTPTYGACFGPLGGGWYYSVIWSPVEP